MADALAPGHKVAYRRRISTLLLGILTLISALALAGLILLGARLVAVGTNLDELRSEAITRLVLIAQLSQEAAATVSIAPAMSADPSRFEFETLRARIQDKEVSQRALIDRLTELMEDEDSASTLRFNGESLIDNLRNLTDLVSRHIDVRERLEEHVDFYRGALRRVDAMPADPQLQPVRQAARAAALSMLNLLLDPVAARLSRNQATAEDAFTRMDATLEMIGVFPTGAVADLAAAWAQDRERMLEDKRNALANVFQINALAEENSLLANRLLSGTGNEFQTASTEIRGQIDAVNTAIRLTIVALAILIAVFVAATFLAWLVLHRRVFQRLNRIRNALREFADRRAHPALDPRRDEIGEISNAMTAYMGVIDAREAELADKSQALEALSKKLAKYLSPQVYESIFSGRQDVKLTSTRKKLTVFFSDIAGFTETADRLASEELSQLLNQYLTDMSHIALAHGATIDKYVGDGILAFFGDPETRGVKEDALACVSMAIAMRGRMSTLREEWRDVGIERPLEIRIGIVTGFCTVGNFGSEDRMDYTIIGGTVNTAARLEAMAEPGDILISYETYALVKEAIICEEHGTMEVRGLAYPVTTYRVVGHRHEQEAAQADFSVTQPGLMLAIRPDEMSSDDRRRAADALRRTLRLLEDGATPSEGT